MSEPIPEKVARLFQNPWKTEMLLMVKSHDLTAQDIALALRLLDEHRDTIEAANDLRQYGQAYVDRDVKERAKRCPFLTEEEALNLVLNARDARQYGEFNRKPKAGYVYVMLNQRNGFYKIGFTRSLPKYREQTLQAEEPEIECIHFHEGTNYDERDLHERYAKKRIRGEWFRLTKADVKAIKALKGAA